MTLPVLFALAGCLAVEPASDHILAHDFATAWPALAGLPSETQVGFAPAPGASRIFTTPELRQLADRFHVTPPPTDAICFERRTVRLEPDDLLTVMQRELPGAHIEIIDFSRAPAPQGSIEFPRSGLHPAPAGGFWNGAIRYAGNHRFLIWARVKLAAAGKRVVSREALQSGQTLDRALFVEQTVDGFPSLGFVSSIEELNGKVLRRPVQAGEPIRTEWLELPKLVQRGETVRVEIQRGGAHLKLEGRAEAAGAGGEVIPVLNPLSHRTFRARVEGPGVVAVEPGKL